MKPLINIVVLFLVLSCSQGEKSNKTISKIDKEKLIKLIEKDIYKGWSRSHFDYFVVDLNDTTNYIKNKINIDKLKFIDKHFYHVCSKEFTQSFSNIVYYSSGELKVFKTINCDVGDDINSVIAFANQKLANDTNKSVVLKNI